LSFLLNKAYRCLLHF